MDIFLGIFFKGNFKKSSNIFFRNSTRNNFGFCSSICSKNNLRILSNFLQRFLPKFLQRFLQEFHWGLLYKLHREFFQKLMQKLLQKLLHILSQNHLHKTERTFFRDFFLIFVILPENSFRDFYEHSFKNFLINSSWVS